MARPRPPLTHVGQRGLMHASARGSATAGESPEHCEDPVELGVDALELFAADVAPRGRNLEGSATLGRRASGIMKARSLVAGPTVGALADVERDTCCRATQLLSE